MKRHWGALGAILAGVFAVVAVAPSAQAYPEPVFQISVNHQVMVGGVPFIGHAKANVACHDWTLTFLDQTASGTGKTFDHTFSTPAVTTKKIYPMHAVCQYTMAAGSAGSALKVAAQTWTGDIPITLLPKGASAAAPVSHASGGGGGLLPGTGGPSFWVLLAGLVLVLGGTTAIVRSRRQSHGSTS